VAAVVVLHPGAEVIAEDLRAHLLDRIARYKIPSRGTLTSDALPRNATGKVIRTQVSERVG